MTLPLDWIQALDSAIAVDVVPYFLARVQNARKEGQVIFPKDEDIFKAFELTMFEEVKVVILGQDPYHDSGQANGLSFSVPAHCTLPPSLKNIFKELKNDLDIPISSHGDLTHWASQGVLLLNASLTVIAGKAGSHNKIGWHRFTDAVIQSLSDNRKNIVFILWGNFAKSKIKFIDSNKHLILTAAHPSPLGAHRGFWGSKPFSKANNYLIENGIKPIDWALPSMDNSQYLFKL